MLSAKIVVLFDTEQANKMYMDIFATFWEYCLPLQMCPKADVCVDVCACVCVCVCV